MCGLSSDPIPKIHFFFTFLFWLKPRSASDPISSAVLPIWDSFYILLNLYVSQVSACFLLPFSYCSSILFKPFQLWISFKSQSHLDYVIYSPPSYPPWGHSFMDDSSYWLFVTLFSMIPALILGYMNIHVNDLSNILPFPLLKLFSVDNITFYSTLTLHFLGDILGLIIFNNCISLKVLVQIYPSLWSLPLVTCISRLHSLVLKFHQSLHPSMVFSLLILLPFQCLLLFMPLFLSLSRSNSMSIITYSHVYTSNSSKCSLALLYSLFKTPYLVKTSFLSAPHLILSRCIHLGRNIALCFFPLRLL